MFKRFLLYTFRWQLSTPILWLVVRNLGMGIGSTIIANLIGAAIFFWVDIFIFNPKRSGQHPGIELWHLKDSDSCGSCGRKEGLWRLVKTVNYDRSKAEPVFLCRSCSRKKLKELKGRGIEAAYCHNG